ncbi:hypothetical protein [Schnuerera sp.]|nr:hypothetical protein [Schnuerera sp.]HSH35490.1 hypothetical protein [Schnuerera sp.]
MNKSKDSLRQIIVENRALTSRAKMLKLIYRYRYLCYNSINSIILERWGI